jgi:hypothetical protein
MVLGFAVSGAPLLMLLMRDPPAHLERAAAGAIAGGLRPWSIRPRIISPVL